MTDTGYLYLAERLEGVLRDVSRSFDQYELDDKWETVVDDDSEDVIAITGRELPAAVLALAGYGGGPDPRATENHPHHLSQLRQHSDCAAAITELSAQRDDHLAALQDAAFYCRNDSYEGKYGDAYLNIESVFDELRPRLPHHQRYRKLLDPDNCTVCGQLWGHDDDCPVENNLAALDERRAHAIAAHVICLDMGEALTAQIRACLDQIEQVAALVVQHQVYAMDDGMAVRPEDLLPALRLEGVDWQYDPERPATIATARHIPLR